MNRKPLGRGLSALISTAPSPQDNEELREIEIDLIRPGEQQPRNTFDAAKLQELAQSIRATGIIQPLLVRRRGGLYELVAGERRWRAAQMAGLTRVPAIVREIPDENLLELALIENIQRQELNAIEEANAYRRLIETLGLTQEEVAQRVGRDRTFITNYLRILKLPNEIQSLLEQEKLTFGHARALLGIADPQLQRRLAQRIHKNNWSVRETENRIRSLNTQERTAVTPQVQQIDPNLRSAEAKLRRRFGTQVRIVAQKPGSAGRIEIEFYSNEDLTRLYDLLTDSHQPLSASASSSV
jgi:ParB family chromosome partitioning protein